MRRLSSAARNDPESGHTLFPIVHRAKLKSIAMSLWTTGTISVVNESAKAFGVRVGMSTQDVATLMLAAAK